MTNEDTLKFQREIYGANFRKHGDTPQGVFWNDEATQYLRFERLLAEILRHEGANSFSLHDVGCGTCALFEYLSNAKVACEYSGTEIVPEMILLCQQKYPDLDVQNRDIVSENETQRYDYVTLSGVLNLRGACPEDVWMTHCKRMLSSMFKMSRYGISFNFLTSNITVASDPTLQYMDPAEILRYCHDTFSRFVIVDHSYPLFEVTVSVFKKEGMQRRYSSTQFAKYFK